MTIETPDPAQQIERQADQLEQDLGRLEDHLDDAKTQLKARQEDARGAGDADEVAGDWEGQAPDRPLGDDAEGFDDPEADDEDEDEEE
jgi:hypothetical protein